MGQGPFSLPPLSPQTQLRNAARENDVKRIAQLLAAGVNVNANDGEALFTAVSKGCLEAVALLLENEADPNSNRVVSAAVASHRVQILYLLLAQGQVPEDCGRLVRVACKKNEFDTVGCLAERIFRKDSWDDKTTADIEEKLRLLCEEVNGQLPGPEEEQAVKILTSHAVRLCAFMNLQAVIKKCPPNTIAVNSSAAKLAIL